MNPDFYNSWRNRVWDDIGGNTDYNAHWNWDQDCGDPNDACFDNSEYIGYLKGITEMSQYIENDGNIPVRGLTVYEDINLKRKLKRNVNLEDQVDELEVKCYFG